MICIHAGASFPIRAVELAETGRARRRSEKTFPKKNAGYRGRSLANWTIHPPKRGCQDGKNQRR